MYYWLTSVSSLNWRCLSIRSGGSRLDSWAWLMVPWTRVTLCWDTCHVMLDTCQARGTHGVLAPRVRAGDAVAGGEHLGPRVLAQALDRAALVIQRTITYRYLVTELAAAPQAHHLSSHTIQEADFALLLSEKYMKYATRRMEISLFCFLHFTYNHWLGLVEQQRHLGRGPGGHSRGGVVQ